MNNKGNKKLRFIVYTSLSIAMVALCTLIIRIPSVKGGYVNFGDIMILITAVILGKLPGLLAGSIGSAMADMIAGYWVYAPGTFVIKGLEGLICGLLVKKARDGKLNTLNISVAAAISVAWMVFGYFMYEYKLGSLLFDNQDFGIAAATLNLPGNIIQGAVSAIAAVPFIHAIRKTKIPFDIND